MSLVRFKSVSMRYDETQVLRDVSSRLRVGDRVGLIGKNGSGKTTVLRLILGRDAPSEGRIDIEPDVSIGYFSQFSELQGAQSIQETLDALFPEIHEIEEEMRRVETAISRGPVPDELDRLLRRQGDLIEKMEHLDGWNRQNVIDTVLTKLGFREAYRSRPIDALSGGWRNRAALARILVEDPDVILLDEPTNYLDIAGLTWLERWLSHLRGALILVTHDRHFLDNVATRIIEIENYQFQEYQGNYTRYVREKPLRLKTLDRQFRHEEELLAIEAAAIADRNEARRNPERHLKRKLADIKKRAEPRPIDRIVTGLYANLSVPNVLCRVEGISKRYGDETLFTETSFEIQRGDRVAVIGPNGCGKTTLLRVLAGLENADHGRIAWGRGDEPFAYYNELLERLDPDDTVTHAVNVVGIAYSAPRREVNRFLSLMQFSELALRQKIGTLSGGQRARIALAQCLLSGAGVILLDEPTNHLDVTSTQVMERALIHFPGAVIVVSHDRFFVDKIATRLIVFEGENRLREVSGNWTTWRAKAAPARRE